MEAFGESTSPFAQEGTKAHAVAELKLRKEIGEINEFSYKAQREALGEIPKEMDDATDFYVDAVMTEYYAAKKLDSTAEMCVEVRLDMSRWVPECFGTSDVCIVSDLSLVTIDLKYGQGVPVEAKENYQLRLYALGAYDSFSSIYAFQHIKGMIVQPRLGSVTEEVNTVEDLLSWADTVVKPAAELAWQGLGEFHAGDHCRFCNVKAICRENVLNSLSVIQNMFDSPDVIDEDRLNRMLPFLDSAKQWIKDVEDYVYKAALNGKRWYGYKLVQGKKPARSWTNETEVIDQLARAGYTEDQYLEAPKLKSVSSMEKELKKKAFSAILGKYVFQGEPKLQLVPESDSREEYSPAELDFGDLVNESV